MVELTDIQKKALEQFDQLALQEGSANKAANRIGISSAAISSIKKVPMPATSKIRSTS